MTTAPARDTARSALGVVGELLVTAGVVVGLFAVYTLFWTGVETADEQDALEAEFDAGSGGSSGGRATTKPDEPAEEQTQVEPFIGDAYARISIPRLGDDWSWIVVQGVDAGSLTRGPGHYPGTAQPGEVGNLAIAGHRATYGEPFARLDQVEVGDEVVVERAGTQHRYRVTESFITGPADADVLLPVPGEPGVEPSRPVVTLTTCHPRWGSSERLVVHGELASSTPVEEVA